MLGRMLGLSAILVLSVAGKASQAAEKPSLNEALKQAYDNGNSVGSITPVFSQLVRFAIPRGFHGVFESTNGPGYTMEMVPDGETVERWTQMITLTGLRGLTANPAVTPGKVVAGMGGGFSRACPGTFAARAIGDFRTAGDQPQDGFMAVFSCGSVTTDKTGPHSETAIIAGIKGSEDYYTLQWAERGFPSSTPLSIDGDAWQAKFARLAPVILCPIIPGEAAPYPSCANQK